MIPYATYGISSRVWLKSTVVVNGVVRGLKSLVTNIRVEYTGEEVAASQSYEKSKGCDLIQHKLNYENHRNCIADCVRELPGLLQ